MPLLNANNPPGRILLWELMALRESALNGYSPLGKLSFAFFGGKVRFLKGERGKPIYWYMLFRTNSLLSFLVFFPFLSIFALIFFFSSYSVFLFCLVKKSSVFLFCLVKKSSVFLSLVQGTARASL